jgi:hypothetical protein
MRWGDKYASTEAVAQGRRARKSVSPATRARRRGEAMVPAHSTSRNCSRAESERLSQFNYGFA